MVTEMTKYDFILLSGDADAFLEKLQSVGVMDITRSMKPIDEKSEKLSNRAEIYRKAIAALKEVAPAEFAEKTYGDLAVNVLETVKGKEEALNQLAQLNKTLDENHAWGRFNVNDIKRLSDLGLKLHFYKAKTTSMDPAWKEQYALSEIATDGNYTYFVVVSDQEGYDFPMKELPAPEKDCSTLEKEIAALKDDIEQKDKHLADCLEARPTPGPRGWGEGRRRLCHRIRRLCSCGDRVVVARDAGPRERVLCDRQS